jgi:anti-sigma regulatory factor (Ser/Thr protein kinase)
MEQFDIKPAMPGWRIYSLCWLIYAVLLGFVSQLDALLAGHLNWWGTVESSLSILPSGLLLTLVWPMTGYLERKGKRLATLVFVHFGGALLFALVSFLAMYTLNSGKNPSLGWYAWPFMYNMITYAFIAGIFHSGRATAASRRQAAAVHQAQNLLIAAELSALRSKLNPHFLFNTLHSIIALTGKNPAAAETALFQCSDMLRYVLDTEKSGSDRVTLSAELDFVRDYLELEALRLGPRLNVEWDLDPAALEYSVPALTLQPLVENSIKHAFNPHSRPGKLLISIHRDERAQALTMAVADDGPGADLAQLRASSGLGIRTVERRLQLDYGPAAGLTIDTTAGAGFAVSVSIPLELARRAA